MVLKQYYLGCLAHASYLIADEETGTAVVVDPQRDIDQYVDEAVRQGLHIRHVFLTHFHADFLAGHLELRDRVGTTIYLRARAETEYAFTPVKDGDVLEFGQVRLTILETPGHTPEGISLLVYDLRKDVRQPHAVLTGDTLFIGDVGRPDLLASIGVSAEELAGLLYDSLHQKLLTLPDETLVYPAHGAGSMCGKNLSTDTVSTIGVQRRYNYALQPMSKAAFIRLVTADQPEAPAYFAYDAMLNRKERPTLAQVLPQELKPLGLEEVLRLMNAGTQVLDVRDPADFEGAHLTSSLNIGLGGPHRVNCVRAHHLGGEEKQGPLAGVAYYTTGNVAKAVHSTLVNILLVMIVGHIIGAIGESLLTRENLITAMITGKKRLPAGRAAPTPRRARPVAATVSVAAFAVFSGGVLAYLATLLPIGWRTLALPATFQDECGACHWAYHPSLLPAASWRLLMQELADHFGEDASLDAEVAADITTFLTANAAETWDTEAANRFRTVAADAPGRISVTPYWVWKHQDLPDGVFSRPSIGGKGACNACHRDADSGRFDDQMITIPKE